MYVVVVLMLSPSLLSACKRTPPTEAPVPSAESAPAREPPPPRCREVTGGGLALSLGTRGKTAVVDDDGQDDVALPFSPEIGSGVAFRDGFVGGALVPGKGSESAAVFVVSEGSPSGRTIDLGKVHGDVSPPRVAAAGDALLVAVTDGAPNGTLVRLARLDDLASGKVKWGAEIPQTSDDSEVVSIEANDHLALVAWDDWDAHAGAEVVKLVSFAPGDVGHVSSPLSLSRPDEDSEGPLLVVRPGGFWAGWLSRDVVKKNANAPSTPAPSSSADVAESMETAPTWIVLAPLDEAGKPAGSAIRVSPKEGHAQSFDLASTKDGGALVAYRDDRSTAGTSGGVVRLVTIRPGGGIDARLVSDDDLGPGVPSLLADGTEPIWLALPSDAGLARLLALDGEGRSLDALLVEPAVGVATLLAMHRGRFLATRPRDKAVEAFVVACDKGASPAPAPAPSASAAAP